LAWRSESKVRALLHAKFHTIDAMIRYRTPKLKILLKFCQISEYKRGKGGVYPLRDTKFAVCRPTSFQDALAVKTWMDLLKGLRSYGVEKDGFPTNFQHPLAVKRCVGPQKLWRSKNVLEILYHHAKFGGDRIKQECQHPLTGQRAANFRLLAIQ